MPRTLTSFDLSGRVKLTNDGSMRTPHGTLGNAIKKLRDERQWTQEKLAKKLGVSQGAVASFEGGRICPSVKTMKLLAVEFNVPIEFLLAHRRTLFAR